MSPIWQNAIVLLAIGWALWRLASSARGLLRGDKAGCPSCVGCGGKQNTPETDSSAPQIVDLAPLPAKRKAPV
jgi:hypothetical protein